ncbi:hypothetical protein CSA37_03965 [Candidatus Fermentibacteria bacterium]|nr:MAG: hypothetical protein CSA37_10750 [Candidatus Fermentibacteria bacterium]PIE52808.1 MAG: hypothetical protein CSA37_03965 [Candidatus Fermentibacteria bacterium]
MRILVTVNCKWWNAAAQGAALAARALAEEGHTVLVQSCSGEVPNKLREMGLPCRKLRAPFSGLRKLAASLQAQAVIAFRSPGQTAAAFTIPCIPLIRYRSDQRKARGGRLWSLVDNRTDLMVFPGASMVGKKHQGPRNGPVTVIPQPVDTNFFKPSDTEKKKIILSLARLSPVKGHKTLIRAMTMVQGDYRAVIAGADAQHTASGLMEYACSLGVGDRIEFAGRVSDVRPFLQQSSIGVVTSLGSEAVSRAGMEMMASGVPLLAAATNGLLDLVQDGVSGLLHSPGNWRQLAAQINHLAENRGLAGYLSSNGLKHCLKELSLEAAGRRWTEELEQVCFS